MMKRFIILCIMFFAWVQSVQAGGFQIGEMATRATGMGSAFTAVANDASAAWYNPAGVAFSSGSEVMLGGDAIISPGVDFTTNTANPLNPASSSTKSKTFFVPHAYYTYMDQGSKLGASISVNSPFGLETEWPTTAAFANKNTFSRIQMANINPSVVFMLTDKVSVAAGFSYAYAINVDLDNTLQHLNGNGDGWGGNAAVFYKGDGFNLGVSYRSRIKINVDGTATAVPGSALAGAPFGATSSSAKTDITLPDIVNVGLAWMPNEDLTLSLDVDWVNWKTFDAINITYGSGAYRGAVGGLGAFAATGSIVTALTVKALQNGKTNLPQNWKSTVAVRAGIEWKYNPQMRARFGYVYDPTPIRNADFSPGIPGNDRHIFSVGYGYDFNSNTTIDLAYAFVYFVKRNQTQSTVGPAAGAPNTVKNGQYKNNVHILATSVSYRF